MCHSARVPDAVYASEFRTQVVDTEEIQKERIAAKPLCSGVISNNWNLIVSFKTFPTEGCNHQNSTESLCATYISISSFKQAELNFTPISDKHNADTQKRSCADTKYLKILLFI